MLMKLWQMPCAGSLSPLRLYSTTGNRALDMMYQRVHRMFTKAVHQRNPHLVASLQVAALEPLCKVAPAACSLHGALPIMGAGRYHVCLCLMRLFVRALLACSLLMLRLDLICLKYL